MFISCYRTTRSYVSFIKNDCISIRIRKKAYNTMAIKNEAKYGPNDV